MVGAHIGQGLGKIVKRLLGKGLYHEDYSLSIADASADSLTLGLVEYGSTIVYQRILTDEVAATLRSLLEEG